MTQLRCIQKIITASILIGLVVLLVAAQALHNRKSAGRFQPAFSCMVQAANHNGCPTANMAGHQNLVTCNIDKKYRLFINLTYSTDYPDNDNIYNQLCFKRHIGSKIFNNPSMQMAVFFYRTET